jgi:hypothetical protein
MRPFSKVETRRSLLDSPSPSPSPSTKKNNVYIEEKKKGRMRIGASNTNDENRHEGMMITCITQEERGG